MGTWYRENRFLKKISQFCRLEQMGLDGLEVGTYSVDYALWKMLQNSQLNGFKFERQQRVLGSVVSFFCKEAKLVVDLDHVDHSLRRREEHESDMLLQKKGIRVLRFTRDAIMERPESVRNSILEVLSMQNQNK